jgi:glycosyltransferase involved in cell wall biosynthesis
MLLNFAREIVWYIGRWKTEEFNKYLDDISPDIVFMPVFGCFYPHRVLKYIRKHTGARIVLFHADDNYTLRQYSISPLYWLYRFILRHYVRDSSKIADLSYCISDIQKNEYEQMLNIPCKTLFKCGDFSGEPPVKQSINYPLKLVFTGNIGSGRWESLALIGDALREINQEGLKAKLEIYTLSPLTGRMRKRLDDGMNIFLCGSISAAEVEKVQEDADILVHVESFKKKYYLVARQSFSTKIVDYLQRARCLLAVGSAECASIDYIDTNNSGVVATTPEMISTKLKLLIDNPSLVQEYGRKGYLCGRRNHQQEKIKGMLRDDLFTVAGISQ